MDIPVSNTKRCSSCSNYEERTIYINNIPTMSGRCLEGAFNVYGLNNMDNHVSDFDESECEQYELGVPC